MNYPIILARNLTKNPQNRGFCAFLAFETPVFGHFEHKIEVFVSEMAIFPWICPLPSTKSAFLCSRGGESGIRKRNRGDAYPSCKSPRTLPKCKYLITKQLTFIAMRGDLLEGNGCTSRFQSPSSRAQKLHFCAFLAFETLVFWLFEHKIEVFVRFCRKVVAHLRETLTERRYTYRARCQN